MVTEIHNASESRARGNVFISYSRADKAFARQIYLALAENGFSPLMDTQAINPAEPWQERLTSMIEECDSVVFVLTAPFLASEPCQFEVSEARRLGKRMIPLVPAPLGDLNVPDDLARLNYIFFYENPNKPDSGFFTGVSELRRGLLVNLDWLREARIYAERAKDYFDTPDNERLLRGSLLVHAQNWMDHCPDGETVDGDTRRYIERSARRENDRILEREREMRARARRARLTLAAGAFLCVLAGIGAWMSFAYAMRAEAARSDQFATVSNELLRRGQSDEALLAALYGLPEDTLTTQLARLSGASFERVETAASVALERRPPPASLRVHDGAIRAFAMVPEFDLYVTAGDDGFFGFVDAHRPDRTELMPNFSGAVRSLAMPDDPKWLVSADGFSVVARDMAVIRSALFGGPTPEDRFNLVQMAATQVAITPDGTRTAFLGEDGRVHVAPTDDLDAYETVFDKDAQASHIAFSPDGTLLAIGLRNGTTELHLLSNESMTAACDQLNAAVSALAFAPNGRSLIIGTRGKGAVRCNLSGRDTQRLTGAPESVTAIAFSADGDQFALAGEEQGLTVYQSGNLAHRDLLLQSRAPVTALRFAPEGDRLVTGDAAGMLREVPLDQADLWRRINWTQDPVIAVRHDCGGPDVSLTVSVSSVGEIAVHDASGALLSAPERRNNRPMTAISCAPGAPLLAIANDLGEAEILSLPSLDSVATHSPNRRDGPILSLDFDSGGEAVLIAHASGFVHSFDVQSGASREILAPERYVRDRAAGLSSAAYVPALEETEAPDLILSARSLGVLTLDAESGTLQAAEKSIGGASSYALSASSRTGHLAQIVKQSGPEEDFSLAVWSARENGILLSAPVGPGVSALAISPDGAFVALGRRDGSVAIYQVEGNLLRREFQLGGIAITDLSFSNDGAEVAAALASGQIAILQTRGEDVRRAEMLANACSHLDETGLRGLDPQLAAIYRALATPISADPCGPIWASVRND